MANVAVAIDMDATYLPYERPPQPQTLWTAIPRGLRGFIVELGTLTAKPVNDTETLVLSGILPANFAYVLSEISLTIFQDEADDWQGAYTLNLQNWYQGFLGVSTNWTIGFSNIAALGGGSKTNGRDTLDYLPRGPMWAPRGTSGIQITIQTFNSQAAVAAAGTVSAYINFWEFDLEQARKYPINAPIPVHSR